MWHIWYVVSETSLQDFLHHQNIHYQQKYSQPIQYNYMSRNPVDADKNSENEQ